jgi:transcriptional regulator with XRE-family HTH domain
MKERLLEFLRIENKTSAQLAEEIGVQASGISHILSGRNNPSLDFVLKMLERYPYLSTDWLLFGKGSMYADSKMHTLFDYNLQDSRENTETSSNKGKISHESDSQDVISAKAISSSINQKEIVASDVVKIVWFFADNSFEEYLPRK